MGVNFEGIPSSLSIYPNPASSILNVKITSNKSEKILLKISDASGKSIITTGISVNDGITQALLNVEKSPAGVYYLNAEINGNSEKVPFVRK
ncbi:MAG: T9SS type A sorting domain-containing protein [Bacteroidota bacterium]|nr:T9SS type A sorting domain-containing protein [Bacteroidota bacterium]